MQFSKRKRPTLYAMNMTPMIDVVFLLIIFFMTVTQASQVNRERVDLPDLAGTEDQQPTTVTINVNAAGEIIVSGQTLSVPRLIAMLAEQGEDAGEGLLIVLRADRRSASRPVNDVVEALSKLGINRVRIAVEVPEGS